MPVAGIKALRDLTHGPGGFVADGRRSRLELGFRRKLQHLKIKGRDDHAPTTLTLGQRWRWR